MKILFLSNVFPNSLHPGKGTFNCSMVQALSELHPTHVVSPVSWLDEFSHHIKKKPSLNREWLPFESPNRLSVEYPRFYYPPKILHSHHGQFLHWSIKKSLHQAISQFQPDIILSYWLHPDGEVAVRAAQEHGLPVVVMTGGSDILLLTKNRHRRRAIKSVLQQADGIITVSDDIMSAVKNMKIHSDKIHTVYRGVNRSLFTPGDQKSARQRLGLPLDRKIVVSVGRLEPVKGHTVLLDACLKISKQDIPFTCYVLGDGSLETTLLRKTNEYGLEEQFQLKGSQQQSRLPDWYRAADVVALPSLSEGIPNVLLEAISCGKQFVASRVGGIPEIADPVCDRLVSPKDPDELSEAICNMFVTPAQSEKRRFEPISWQESAVHISQILSDCSTRFSSGLTNKQKMQPPYQRYKRKTRQQT